MAYVNSTRTNALSLSDRFAGVLSTVRQALHRRHVYSTTRAELMALSDRDLADLGLNRASINAVAHEAAYGN